MSKGRLYPTESKTSFDYRTGARIRQVTNNRSIHHHPFFLIPAYDDMMQYLFFISCRTGKPQIFAEHRDTGQLSQLTDREDIEDWTVHPARNGKFVYFTTRTGLWRVATNGLREEQLCDLTDLEGTRKLYDGLATAAMGGIALSRDDRWCALRYTSQGESFMDIVDTASGHTRNILCRDEISHIQFCPDDANLLFYAGPLKDRVWTIHRDGSNNRRLYERNADAKEWITHESWIPGTRELAIIDWPRGIRCIHAETRVERRVCSFNAWHAICNDEGTRMVADTNFPDIGLQLFNPRDGVGAPNVLCYPEASSFGEHWDGPFPYDNGSISVYAPQHTHPHPRFSPDGRIVVYTSDRSGYSQIYEVLLEP